MKTNMDVRSLGERESNYTNSSVRQMKQKKDSKNKKSSGTGNGVIAAGLLAGAGVGVLAGMLLAPKTGKDLRKQVTDSANKLGSQASDLYNSSREKVTSWTGKAKRSSSGSYGRSKSATSTTNSTPGGRDINNDPATSITM